MEIQEIIIEANKLILEDEQNQNQGTAAAATITGTGDRCNFTKLPWHVVLEIMLKVPIEGLMRCRYVCKAWHELLLDPSFAKLYHGGSSAPTVVVLLQSSLFPHGNSGALYLIDPQEQEPSTIIAKFDHFPYLESTLVNSCNGLICSCDVRMGNPIYISNPVRGEFLTLPKGETNPDRQFVSGFGFSAKSNQYKVIKYSEFVEIYTLGSGAWRRSKRVPPARHQSLFGIFFNGALHWLVKLPNQSVLIRCFDLDDEKFRTIPLPLSTFYEANFIRTHVGVLGDCLCLSSIVASISSVWEIQIWVMKEYGVRESWMKELTIKYPTPWEHWWSLQSIKVVTCLKNGEVEFDCEGSPAVYNVEQESFRLLKPNGISLTHVNGIAHAPSFVSLKDIAMGDGSKLFNF
jgi:F-box interacting protein